MLLNLFGPNTLTKLAARKNQDLEKALASKLSAEYAHKYLDTLKERFAKPDVQAHFNSYFAAEGDEVDNTKDKHKLDSLQLFYLSQAANVPLIFRHCLEPAHVSKCLDLLVPAAFVPKKDQEFV